MKQYEVILTVKATGDIIRGGIPTSKAHAQLWANQNTKMYGDAEVFSVSEYQPEGSANESNF